MPQHRVHADISTQQFPYNFFELSSTVLINSQLEQDASGQNPGVPQAYHMENVMPLSRGYSSIAFTEKVPPNEDITGIIDSFPIYGEGGRIALFQYSESSAWVFDPSGGVWSELELPTAGLETVTHGTVREVTYIHLGIGLFTYNFSTQELEQFNLGTLPGVGNTLGVAAAGSQLILWDNNRLYLSSVVEPTDFTPSIDTGAGTAQIQQLRGTIVACVTLGRNFIVYSNVNAISARWTDNLAFPYRYDHIRGSSGINTIRHVAFNGKIGAHIVWTQSGFQQVTIEEAGYIWPELSDGIIRGILIRQNPIFEIPELTYADNLDVTINFISNRYIAVSVIWLNEEDEFKDCYVFDTLLKRWGKLSIPHAGFVEYVVPEVFEPFTYDELESDYSTYGEITATGLSYRGLIPGRNIPEIQIGSNLGIVLPNGSVQAISYQETSDFRGTDGAEFNAATPKLFLGKYKINRTEGILTQWLKISKLFDAELKWYGHMYNGEFCNTKEIEVENDNQPGQFFGMMSSDSVSLEIRGSFKLTDLQLCLSTAGVINQGGIDQRNLGISALAALETEVFPEPSNCCEWTSERMKQNIVFPAVSSFDNITVEFDLQNCGERTYVTTSVLGSDNDISNLPEDASYFTRDVLGSPVIDTEFRPEKPASIPLYSRWELSNGQRTLIAHLDVSTNGEVYLINVDRAQSETNLAGLEDAGGADPDPRPGLAVHNTWWRLASE